MALVIQIHSIDTQVPILVMGENTASKLGVAGKKRVYISFGAKKHFVTVEIQDYVEEDAIHLADKVIQELYIPLGLPYEAIFRENEILIGPLIGILVSKNKIKLTENKLHKLQKKVRQYDKVHGSIIVFALDQINKEKLLIEAYYYDPNQKGWNKEKFPYPLVILRQITLTEEWRNHFLNVIGDGLISNYHFNKWEMVEWFADDLSISTHLPKTVLYQTPEDVFVMLSQYGSVYAKPIGGMQGAGIVRISKIDERYVLEYRKKDTNHQVCITDKKEVVKDMTTFFDRSDYLIQQPIELLQYNEGSIDFRSVIQKDEMGQWNCITIMAKIGAATSIVSNIHRGGKGLGAKEALQLVFAGEPEIISEWISRLQTFSLEIGKKVDSIGIRCVNLGIDLAIDMHGKLWLIEINNRDPNLIAVLFADGKEAFLDAVSAPLLYAKHVAGFRHLQENI